ncbi:MAG: 16S rRNA (cytidine(1402)-2'-O)-methyltransferase [Alphaproteobacteria bacterium]|nr:16S rRNA (cytidine(1402)-2'-O)-methyltransferase [Alphaproteobacteria bacterium]
MPARPPDPRRPPQPASGADPLPAGLYVVATPIGNARDITLHALDILGSASVIAAEDTRQTRKLLGLHGLRAKLIAYHAHNEAKETPGLVERVRAGEAIALVSDAGTPLISDPGARLVAALRAEDLPVFAVPGPSSLTAALSVAGLPAEEVHFAGFPPTRGKARAALFARLAGLEASLVLLEAPHRLAGTLADLAQALGPDRPAAIARELTKLYEEVLSGPLGTLAARIAEAPVKGEIVLVIAPPAKAAPAGADALDAALGLALSSMSLKEAASHVAARLGLPRRTVYARALALRDGAEEGP